MLLLSTFPFAIFDVFALFSITFALFALLSPPHCTLPVASSDSSPFLLGFPSNKIMLLEAPAFQFSVPPPLSLFHSHRILIPFLLISPSLLTSLSFFHYKHYFDCGHVLLHKPNLIYLPCSPFIPFSSSSFSFLLPLHLNPLSFNSTRKEVMVQLFE
jgi:hypothetical protein